MTRDSLQDKFGLTIPNYKGGQQFLKLSESKSTVDPSGMRQNYDKGGLVEEKLNSDPLKEFDRYDGAFYWSKSTGHTFLFPNDGR